jgi:hypothetical protein
MHVSMQTRYIAEANTRIQARRRPEGGGNGREILRILENPGEGRRQGNFSRRPRPDNARTRDLEGYATETRPSLMRSAPQSKAPFSTIAKAAEFWTLLGAVTPDETSHGAGENPAVTKKEPSLQELLARVIATH